VVSLFSAILAISCGLYVWRRFGEFDFYWFSSGILGVICILGSWTAFQEWRILRSMLPPG
jgi:hypothetical protein